MTPLENAARALEFADEMFVAGAGEGVVSRASPDWSAALARAVLYSIREPSEEVIDAMMDLLTERGCNPLSGDAEAVWETGIDTILESTP